MMNFSLIFPTRERPELLNNLFCSLKETTSNKSLVEILIAIDDDDPTDIESIVEQYPELNIKLFNVKRSTNFSKDYYNFLARQSKGKFIWALNDDVEFVTKFWDIILNAEIEVFLKDKKDRILFCMTDDGLGKHTCVCFPIISKETFKETKYVFNEIYPTWTADQDITRLYNNYLSGIRTLNMRGKVGVKHISYHTCLRGKDKNASYMRANMKVTDGIDYTERSIRNITNRINKYKEKAMVFRKVEPKVEPVKEKKEIVIEVDAKVEVVKDYKGVGDDIVTNPTIG